MWVFWEAGNYYSLETKETSSTTNIHNILFTEWEQVKKYAENKYNEIVKTEEPYEHSFEHIVSEADFAEYDEIDVFHADLDYGCYIIGKILKMKKFDTAAQQPS